MGCLPWVAGKKLYFPEQRRSGLFRSGQNIKCATRGRLFVALFALAERRHDNLEPTDRWPSVDII
jgi:hypothetical protein